MKVLYISYDGLTDPLGRSQVLPYLIGLRRLGHEITILSCEKPARFARDGEHIRSICESTGLEWTPISYHKSPPVLSTMWDAVMLRRAADRLHLERGFDLVHCRSYIASMAGLRLKRDRAVRYLFDMRGFWPEERVEGGLWPLRNPLFRAIFRYFKRLESSFLREADHIISLTAAGKRQLLTRPELEGAAHRITVIPCCVDFDHFTLTSPLERQGARSQLSIPDEARVVAYLGSVGTWYMLEEMLDFFRLYLARHENAYFLFVTPDDARQIRDSAAARGIAAEHIVVRSASRDEVPSLMAAADLGLFFIKPVFSKIASSPTKMGEMLALGLPIVTNGKVGDVAEIVERTDCGVALDGFDDERYRHALDRIGHLETLPEERRARALHWFDIEEGIASYDRVYRMI